jgi:apolipoprotein N-acyltransferase
MNSIFISSLICLSSGALYALAYPSFLGSGWFPLLFMALPLFVWKLEASGKIRYTALFILCFNLGLNIVGYYWIPHTLREFGQLPYPVSILLGLSFAVILQPHWWLYLLWKMWRPKFDWHSETGVLLTAFVLTLMERYIPQQFPSFVGSPWLHLAPYLGLTPWFGVVVFSFITFWVALETVTQLQRKTFRPVVWLTLLLFVLTNALMPLKRPEAQASLPVRIVQANIGNFLKIESERGDGNSYETINKKYFGLSTTDNGFLPSLIIWPETAYPNTFFGHLTELAPLFKDIMKTTGAEILIGGYDQDLKKSTHDLYESVFNSSILMSEGKVKASYHKNILIPFGETLPFGPFNKDIISVVPAVSLFARGEGTPLMQTREGHRFVTPICYEILESNFMRQLLNQYKDNHFIVNHTNDSWYGKTAEPYQHLFLAKWRALEFNLPILRSTNTGITSVIFPDASESRRLSIGEEAILDVTLPISASQNTFYQVYGIYPFLGFFAILLALTLWRRKD